MCKRHPNKKIEWVCKKDQALVCLICAFEFNLMVVPYDKKMVQEICEKLIEVTNRKAEKVKNALERFKL